MTDKTELKRLAEAFPDDLDFDSNTEPFFNGPSGESLGGGSTGFYSVYGKPFFIEGDDYEYDGPTYVESCNVDFAKFIVAAREGVLALLAEIGALRSQVAALQSDPNSWQSGYDEGRCIGTKTALDERGQLRAEVEALRKDAERYRWLRGQHWNESEMAVVCHPKKGVKLGFDCPSEGRLDSAIDFAMSEGEQP